MEIKPGDKFGKWIVIKRDGYLDKNKKAYLCQCQCEFKTIVKVRGYALRRGTSNSCTKCRVPRKQIIIGNKYNNWIVIAESSKHGRLAYKCQCDCENKTEYILTSQELYETRRKSCRKCRTKRQKGSISSAWGGFGFISKTYESSVKIHARETGKIYDLDLKFMHDLFNEQNGRCALTGNYLFFSRIAYNNEQTASLDRIESDKGYTKDNVQWIYKPLNFIKGNSSDESLKLFCSKVVKNLYIKYPIIEYKFNEMNKEFKGFEDLAYATFARTVRNAEKYNREINIDIEYCWQLAVKQNFRCILTGDILRFGHDKYCTASLDRIDNTKGYIKGNVRWLTKEANMRRQDYSDELLIILCRQIYEYDQLNGDIFSFI